MSKGRQLFLSNIGEANVAVRSGSRLTGRGAISDYASILATALALAATLGAAAKLRADDKHAPIQIDLGGVVVQAIESLGAETPAADETSPALPLGATEAEGFGGLELPENVQRMMKSAQQIQAIRIKYDDAVNQLIEQAQRLDEPDGAKDRTARVAALAKAAVRLRREMDAKHEEMVKEMRLGLGTGIGILNGEGVKTDVEISPAFPNGGFVLPQFEPPQVDGVELP